jgi:hypothetical protein
MMSQTGGKRTAAATADDGVSYTFLGSADEAKHLRSQAHTKQCRTKTISCRSSPALPHCGRTIGRHRGETNRIPEGMSSHLLRTKIKIIP